MSQTQTATEVAIDALKDCIEEAREEIQQARQAIQRLKGTSRKPRKQKAPATSAPEPAAESPTPDAGHGGGANGTAEKIGDRVFNLLKMTGKWTPSGEISRATGLGPVQVIQALRRLVQAGDVRKHGERKKALYAVGAIEHAEAAGK